MSFDGTFEPGKGFGYDLIKKTKGKNVKNDWYTGQLRQYLGELDQFNINEMDTGGIEVGKMYFLSTEHLLLDLNFLILNH